MLTLRDLLDDARDASGNISEEALNLNIVISDYNFQLHDVVGDNIMFDWMNGQLVLELHSEIEDGSA